MKFTDIKTTAKNIEDLKKALTAYEDLLLNQKFDAFSRYLNGKTITFKCGPKFTRNARLTVTVKNFDEIWLYSDPKYFSADLELKGEIPYPETAEGIQVLSDKDMYLKAGEAADKIDCWFLSLFINNGTETHSNDGKTWTRIVTGKNSDIAWAFLEMVDLLMANKIAVIE